MRYQLIRDKKILELNESLIEVCDNDDEIINFSLKELMNLLVELKDSDYKDPDIYVDIYAVIKNIHETRSIPLEDIENLYHEKLQEFGTFSRYLLKIN